MRRIVYWLSLLLIFMIPWENALAVGDLGSLNRVAGILVAAAWVSLVLVNGQFRKPHLFHWGMSLFVLWSAGSIFWSFDRDGTLSRVQTYVQLLGLIFILWDLYATQEALHAGMQAYVLGACVSAGSTILNYFTGQEAYVYSGGRYAGAGLNADDLALILALALSLAWYLATSLKNNATGRILKLVNLAYMPVGLFAILLTASRMGVLAVVPVVLFVLVTSQQLPLKARVGAAAAFLLAFFLLLPHIPEPAIARLSTISSSLEQGDLGGRVDLWRGVLGVFAEHPLIGVGSGAIDAFPDVGAVAHNTFLSVLAELGLVGFILFLGVLMVVVHEALGQPTQRSVAWLTVLAVWTIGVSTLSWEFRKPTWLLMGLLIVSAHLQNRDDSGAPPEPGYCENPGGPGV